MDKEKGRCCIATNVRCADCIDTEEDELKAIHKSIRNYVQNLKPEWSQSKWLIEDIITCTDKAVNEYIY
jgi:hypothetical protein